MKVLFVYRGYRANYSNSVVDFQRVSLQKEGIEILYFQYIVVELKVISNPI